MLAGWHSLAAVLVLAASLALKLATQDSAIVEGEQGAVQALARSLADRGYRVAMARPGLPIVQAARNGCRFSARLLDPYATFRDTELRKLPRGWRVIYAWRAHADSAMPRLGPLSEYYVAREMARIGRATSRAPVVMVSIQPGCAPPDPAALDVRADLRQSGGAAQRIMPRQDGSPFRR